MRDLIVVGAGPVGWAAAAAAAARGLDTLLLAPEPEADWPARYGAWTDELAAVGLTELAAETWARTVIRFDASRHVELDRGYARVDGRRLAARLRAEGSAAGLRTERGHAVGLDAGSDRSTVVLDDGRRREARAVIDASGHRPCLLRRVHDDPPAAQTAYGIECSVDRHPWAADTMLLMDFDDVHVDPVGRARGPASFLYAMPLGPRRVFVEETVLVGRPPVPIEVLEARLRRRLSLLEIRVEAVHEVERCFIPMGEVPPEPQRAIGLGAAAGMVHPATGYQLGRGVAAAREAVATIERGLRAGADPDAIAAEAWAGVWPRDRRRVWALYRLGMEVLLDLPPAAIRAFFASFFEIDRAHWSGYLSASVDAGGVARAMSAVFARAPASLRRAILARSLGPAGLELLRAW